MEQQTSYDEISLVELVVLWLKHWKLGGLAALFVFVVGLLVILSIPSKYESKVELKVGGKDRQDLFEQPQALMAGLKAKYRVGDKFQSKRELPRLESVSIDERSDNGIVTFVAKAYTAQEASDYLKLVVAPILEKHGNLYEKFLEQKANNIQKLTSYIELNEGNKEINVGASIRYIGALKEAMASAYKTYLLSPPSTPMVPSSPDRIILIIVVMMISISTWLVFPFFLIFLTSVKEELKKQDETKNVQ